MTSRVLWLGDDSLHAHATWSVAGELAERFGARLVTQRNSVPASAAVLEDPPAFIVMASGTDRDALRSLLALAPLVAVPPGSVTADGEALSGECVVCSLAGPHDLPCARLAARLSDRLGIALTIAHTLDGEAVGRTTTHEPPAAWLVDGILREVIERCGAAPPHVRLSTRSAAEAAIELAAETRAAVLTVGSAEESVWSHLLSRAHQPVVICPPGG